MKNNSSVNLRNKTDSIGQILSLKNSAQIKQSREFLWSDIHNSDYVQNNDSLFVGPNSEVTLKLNNNEIITLEENSMLSFNQSDSTFDIALKFGGISSESISKKIEVSICGKKEWINPANAKNISIIKNKNCKIEIKAKSGQFQIAERKIAALKQIDNSIILSEGTFETYESAENSEKLVVNSNTNSSFLTSGQPAEEIFHSEPVNVATSGPELESTKQTKNISQVEKKETKILNVEFSPPQIDESYKKKNFYSQDKNSTYLHLRWQNTNTQIQVDQSQIEISQNKNFKKIFQSETTNKNSILIKTKMDDGTYFWRVRFKSKQKYSDWSELAQLSIF